MPFAGRWQREKFRLLVTYCGMKRFMRTCSYIRGWCTGGCIQTSCGASLGIQANPSNSGIFQELSAETVCCATGAGALICPRKSLSSQRTSGANAQFCATFDRKRLSEADEAQVGAFIAEGRRLFCAPPPWETQIVISNAKRRRLCTKIIEAWKQNHPDVSCRYVACENIGHFWLYMGLVLRGRFGA